MTKHTISFSLDIRVGDSTLQESVSGAMEVNLYDNPEEDEINRWCEAPGVPALALLYKVQAKMERLAIEQARLQLAKDQGEAAIEQTPC